MFTWFDETSEDKDIISTLVLSLFDLFGGDGLSALYLARDRRLRHVADEHVLLGVWQVLFQPQQPVLVVDDF